MEYKYAPYWKQILALIIDGIAGFVFGSTLFLVIGKHINISFMLVVFISTLVMQVFFYYGYGDKSFGDHMLKLKVVFIEKKRSRLLNALMISFGKTLIIVPYGIPFFGPILALINILITFILQFTPKHKKKKQTGWNITIAYVIEDSV